MSAKPTKLKFQVIVGMEEKQIVVTTSVVTIIVPERLNYLKGRKNGLVTFKLAQCPANIF